ISTFDNPEEDNSDGGNSAGHVTHPTEGNMMTVRPGTSVTRSTATPASLVRAPTMAAVSPPMRATTWKPTRTLWGLAATALSLGFFASPATAKDKPASSPVTCSQLATDPALGLARNRDIKSVSAAIIAASGPNKAYCQVNVLYGTSANQNINIRVGLPLNSVDGGTGGVQGAWNGRTQGVGGGGCAGNLTVTAPVNSGYVGSGTDTGHTGGDCEPGVNLDGTYNFQFIEDFIRNAIKQQVLLSKSIARAYYA